MTEPNPLEIQKKEIGEFKRIIHSLASVPREIAFMVTPQRSRRLCWPVSEDKIKDYIETERFVDDEFDLAGNAPLTSTIQQEQAVLDAIDNARSESSEDDEEDDDELRKYDTPVLSLMPEYEKQRKLRKRKREGEQEEKLIENIELTVAYNDQQGPKLSQAMDPYLYKSKDCDIELRLLVQQLWQKLFEDQANDQSKNPTLDSTTTSFLVLEAKNMLNELMTTLLHLRRFGGAKLTLGLNSDWFGTAEDKRRRYAASTAGSWETVLHALAVMGLPQDFVDSMTRQLESIYRDKDALDRVKKRLEKPKTKRNTKTSSQTSQNTDETSELSEKQEKKKSKRKSKRRKKEHEDQENNNNINSDHNNNNSDVAED